MCGFVSLFSCSKPWDKRVLRSASEHMYKRGPDDYGEWWSNDEMIGMSHRRLAIIDLDKRSGQPMHSIDDRFVIVFNGEIYNYKRLRSKLRDIGFEFRTNSDTEVILALFSKYGEKSFKYLRGMFAISIWDKKKKKLFLARDPYGIKPLYFSKTKDGYIVASQVKAILSSGIVSKAPCPLGRGGFWLLGSVPEPYTWFKNIKPIGPGSCCCISKLGMYDKKLVSIQNIWNLAEKKTSSAEIQKNVSHLIKDSIESHLVSDVPVGIFLSGGIDSSSILSIVSDMGIKDLKCITLKYDELHGSLDDESIPAAEIAKMYGFEHHVRVVKKDEFEKDFDKIISSMDQPSIDGINTWYASKCASELGLKVVISGIGGDELFQGYNNFKIIPRMLLLNKLFDNLIGFKYFYHYIFKVISKYNNNPKWELTPSFSTSVYKAWFLRRSIYTVNELDGLMESNLYLDFIKKFNLRKMIFGETSDMPKDHKLAISLIESTCYLRNQLLRDGDWASMAHSVELRTPLVDYFLLTGLKEYMCEFSKYKNKTLLSTASNNGLPSYITNRKKTGFSIPVNKWIKEIYPDVNHKHPSRGLAKIVSNNIYKDL